MLTLNMKTPVFEDSLLKPLQQASRKKRTQLLVVSSLGMVPGVWTFLRPSGMGDSVESFSSLELKCGLVAAAVIAYFLGVFIAQGLRDTMDCWKRHGQRQRLDFDDSLIWNNSKQERHGPFYTHVPDLNGGLFSFKSLLLTRIVFEFAFPAFVGMLSLWTLVSWN